MQLGDLVRIKNGMIGIIIQIEAKNPMSRRRPWAILHCGEKYSLRDLEVVNESR
jgi:hypothetical protein